ncbi:hypothetical protein [Alkalicoccus luteus]|uniref:Uncharacterized protein n=1 Tax=Alkalicoccus luteus TaxID=1237094 RepID=A0A969PWV7_9BACI|nr:hypothetical protein [Alkalicoccus luteus]NJP38959.1 hypothetical protein [Alkalicoccus luteus]
MSDKEKLQVTMPATLKKELERMANETGISQNHLSVLALHSLTKNYKEKGSFIFADLLNPEHRN